MVTFHYKPLLEIGIDVMKELGHVGRRSYLLINISTCAKSILLHMALWNLISPIINI